MNVFASIVSGLVILIGAQLIIRYVLDPITQQRKLIGEIAHVLLYYAHVYMNPDPNYSKEVGGKVADVLREKAGLLFAVTYSIPWYKCLARLNLVPDEILVKYAWLDLTFLSNSVYHGTSKDNAEARKNIISALRIPDWSKKTK